MEKHTAKPEKKPRRPMRTRTKVLLAVLLVLLLLLLAGWGFWHSGRLAVHRNVAGQLPEQEKSSRTIEPAEDGYVHYQGKTYRYNQNIITALCMGIDADLNSGSGQWGSSGQADSIFLVALDEQTGRVRLISISRDTMTEVEAYDGQGNYQGLALDHLAVGYAYGDGGKASCEMMVRNVSRLFYGIPINLYAAIEMEAIAPLNDAVGGVTVTMLDDYFANIKPYYWKQGQTVTLQGEMAHSYVRSRDTYSDGSNNGRMARQKQYAVAYVQAAKQALKSDPSLVLDLYNVASQYMVTNAGAAQAVYLASQTLSLSFSADDICAVEGENRFGGEYDEFYADDRALYELILDVFYTEVA